MKPLMWILAASALLATPATADWQNTTWQMNRQQVVRATSANPVVGQPGDQVFGADLGAEGRYSALGFEFKSQFYFDQADRLRVVRLTVDDMTRCDALKESLRGLYGTPVEDDRVSTVWLDVQKNNRVRFTGAMPRLNFSCFVAYVPISTGGASGL